MNIQNFTLDKTLFNKELYTNINKLWFEGITSDVKSPTPDLMKKWFMPSPEQKEKFDAACTTHSGEALASIGPDKLILPPFRSHDAETQEAATLAKPFLEEVKSAQKQSDKEAADTLLALCLLLDQMPRNSFREPHNLPLVYTHYDRLAVALLRSSLQLSPRPTEFKENRLRPVVMMWYYMPLLHSEDLAQHRLWFELMAQMKKELEATGDDETVKALKGNYDAEQDHLKPLERFGRYPHRNEYLGRKNTPEEEEYLKTAETFGVKSTAQEDGEKDEL